MTNISLQLRLVHLVLALLDYLARCQHVHLPAAQEPSDFSCCHQCLCRDLPPSTLEPARLGDLCHSTCAVFVPHLCHGTTCRLWSISASDSRSLKSIRPMCPCDMDLDTQPDLHGEHPGVEDGNIWHLWRYSNQTYTVLEISIRAQLSRWLLLHVGALVRLLGISCSLHVLILALWSAPRKDLVYAIWIQNHICLFAPLPIRFVDKQSALLVCESPWLATLWFFQIHGVLPLHETGFLPHLLFCTGGLWIDITASCGALWSFDWTYLDSENLSKTRLTVFTEGGRLNAVRLGATRIRIVCACLWSEDKKWVLLLPSWLWSYTSFPLYPLLRKSVGRRDPLHAILKCWFPGMIFGRSPIPDLLHLTSVFACGQRNCDHFFCPFVVPGISQGLRCPVQRRW